MDAYGLSPYDAEILTTDRTLSDYYETAVYAYGGEAKVVSNWIMNDLLRLLNELNLSADELRLTPEYLADILKMIDAGKINASTGKSLLRKVQESGKALGKQSGSRKVDSRTNKKAMPVLWKDWY